MSKECRIPALRFKGFSDPWEQHKFSDEAVIRRGLTYSPIDIDKTGIRVLRSSNIDEESFKTFDNDVFVRKNAVNIDFADNGDILITSANGSPRLVGKHAIIKDLPTNSAVHGGFMLVAKAKNPQFLNSSMSSRWYRKFLSLYIAGGNGAIGNLNASELESFEIYIPNNDEQNKIGFLFDNLDNLIALNQRKYDKLVSFKKALLEKMFPQSRHNFPSLRFKGFADPWEQRKLGELADIIGGGTPSTSVDKYWNGDINWYSPAEINDQIFISHSVNKITKEGYENSSAKMLPVGSVLFTSRAGIGKMAILSETGCTNQGFQSIVPHSKELDSYFVYSRSSELKRYGEITGAGSTFVEVSGKQMVNMDMSIPFNYNEQIKIGFFFKVLDNLIALHQRKCEKLKNIKKSLLEKMFA